MADDALDLDHGNELSSRASSGNFAVVTRDINDPDHPAPCCWFRFGCDDPPGTKITVDVYVNGDDESLRTSEGALADAALVAWLLTHREELIRLAHVGHAYEHERGGS